MYVLMPSIWCYSISRSIAILDFNMVQLREEGFSFGVVVIYGWSWNWILQNSKVQGSLTDTFTRPSVLLLMLFA